MVLRSRSLLAVFLVLPSFLAASGPARATDPTPEVREMLAEAEGLLSRQQHDGALRLFRKAAKEAGDGCLDCEIGLARAYRAAKAYKNALEHAENALGLAEDGDVLGVIHSELGLSNLALDKDGSTESAIVHFRQAIEKTGGASSVLYFNLGYSLLKLGRDEEGVAALEDFLERVPADSEGAVRAQGLIDKPRRAREDLVPAFSASTLDGRYLTDEDLEGKVVLFDFWATWCGPCVAALPHLRRLHKRQEGSPFELVSISIDHDESLLKAFIEKEEMNWTQIHDQYGKVTRGAFEVQSYPTYVLVNHEGEVVYRSSGWSPRMESEVTQQVGRALKRAKKAGVGE